MHIGEGPDMMAGEVADADVRCRLIPVARIGGTLLIVQGAGRVVAGVVASVVVAVLVTRAGIAVTVVNRGSRRCCGAHLCVAPLAARADARHG